MQVCLFEEDPLNSEIFEGQVLGLQIFQSSMDLASRPGLDWSQGKAKDLALRVALAPSLVMLFPICLYRLNCTKFGKLILVKIIKTVATRYHIFTLKCTKFDFGWGSAPDPTGGAYSTHSDPVAGFRPASRVEQVDLSRLGPSKWGRVGL